MEPFDFSKLERKPLEPLYKYLEVLDEPKQYKPAPTMLEAIGHPRPGSSYKGYCPIITDYINTISTAQDRIPNSGVVKCLNDEWRLLTERECWRLQGFSDEDFEAAQRANPGKPDKKNRALYKQAGNSIPVPVLEAIFKELLPYVI